MRVIRESPVMPPGFTVIGEKAAAGSVKANSDRFGGDLGLIELNAAGLEVLRIEAGTPVFGKEVTERNLPQEFGRDVARSISSKAATWARRPWLASMRWGMSTNS